MKSSISDNNEYPNFCKLAYENDVVFNNFKNNNVYMEILEHVSFEDGLKYIKEIKLNKSSLFNNICKFKTNDSIGNPVKYKFEEPYGEMSPTTIRYIKILYDLCENFENLDNKNIVEIGAGYGGQCKIISDIFNYKTYTIFDLKEVSLLIGKYLNKMNVNHYIADFNNIKDTNYDLCISNYAFTECSKDIQNIYIDKVIKTSKHGYMICNFISHIFNLNSYSKNELISELGKYHTLKVIEEKPITYNNNITIMW